MVTLQDATYILDTYPLPNRLKQRITGIICEEFEKIGFSAFHQLYSRIDYLIEKFSSNWHERFFLHLDRPISGSQGKNFYEILNIKNAKFEEQEEDRETMHIDDIVELLSSKLDMTQAKIVRHLARENGQYEIYITPQKIINNLPEIVERLEEIIRAYYRDGKLLMPRRPVIDIQFNPLSIKIDGRGRKPREFSSQELQKINSAYYDCRGNVAGMLRCLDFKVSQKPIKRCLLEQGLKTMRGMYLEIPESGQERIIESYHIYNGSAYKAAKDLPYSHSTILRYWRKVGFKILEPTVGPSRKLSDEKQKAVLEAYNECDGSARVVARKLGFSKATILKYWRKAKYPILEVGSNQNKVSYVANI